MNWLQRRRFEILLTVTFLSFGAFPFFRGIYGERVLLHVLMTLVCLAALFAIFDKRKLRLAALLLAAPTFVGIWTDYSRLGMTPPMIVAAHVASAIFMSFCVIAILRTAFAQAVVSADSVYGAFCGYILIGLAFGHLYVAIETLTPGSITGLSSNRLPNEGTERLRFELTYFSFATLATVGYGDMTPVGDGARGMAMVEAVIGQFYLAVLVAELIGKRVSQMLSGPPSEPQK